LASAVAAISTPPVRALFGPSNTVANPSWFGLIGSDSPTNTTLPARSGGGPAASSRCSEIVGIRPTGP
jgi:hypothetical protein